MFWRRFVFIKKDTKIEALQRDVKSLRDRVAMLECPHNIRDLVIEDYRLYLSLYAGKKFCQSCGKIFEVYRDYDSLTKARNKLMRELIALNEKEIKK
jgi:hypothetical protein